MKPRHIGMGLALAIAAGLVIFGDRTPDTGIAEPVQRAAAPHLPTTPSPAGPSPATASSSAAPADVAIARLIPRDELMGADSDDSESAFLSQNWTPPPPPAPAGPPPPPPEPTAPPLTYVFIGKARSAAGWEVYLTQGERVMLVKQGDVLDNTWRVDSIAPPNMTLTYLPLNQVQQLNIGVTE
ncbi:hypothetical protein E4L96_21845 [Massilia arenosa]|uniref:Secretion system X translation initiation factor n=1 Tax=Zemynaea arenosa TaxID=2561931 RepID=A0A4Y9RQJ4_9BURK|nr:hypothetical protein [Massilia arenosa]TFW11370.1 hypothetical protein E4L96_21845 [Massilia arenosa]